MLSFASVPIATVWISWFSKFTKRQVTTIDFVFVLVCEQVNLVESFGKAIAVNANSIRKDMHGMLSFGIVIIVAFVLGAYRSRDDGDEFAS